MMATRQQPGLIKKVYDAVALLALLNVAALVGLAGFFTANGTLTGERIRGAVDALRGCASQPVAAALAQLPAASPTQTLPTAAVPATGVELEIAQREAERLKTEIEQRLALANSIMLKVKTEREAFRQERDAASKQQQADRAKQQDEGFQKQLEILTSLAPKMALSHLLALNDPDKAAQMLVTMDTDRARKIVESAKRGDDLTKMKAILQRMQDVAPTVREELRAQGNNEP